MALTTTSISRWPDDLLLLTLGPVLAQALVDDFCLYAPEWQPPKHRPSLRTLVTTARLSAVCVLWRQLVYSILRNALSPGAARSTPSPVVEQFPLWTVYVDTLRQLHVRIRELRTHEIKIYRDIVPIPAPLPQQQPTLTVGTPLTPTGLPTPPLAQAPPSPTPPNSLDAVATATTTPVANSIPLFALLELYARADVFRQTYRHPDCRNVLSLSISEAQAVDAFTYLGQARALISHLKVDELRVALDLVLQETERDVAFALQVCGWKETLDRVCTFSQWDQQTACEVYACLLEVERHLKTAPAPLLQSSGLGRMISTTSRAPHIVPILVGNELINCQAKALSLSPIWMTLLLGLYGF